MNPALTTLAALLACAALAAQAATPAQPAQPPKAAPAKAASAPAAKATAKPGGAVPVAGGDGGGVATDGSNLGTQIGPKKPKCPDPLNNACPAAKVQVNK